ncbi:unnamed protein product [Rotaria sp. Silwood1]|nr:unnamed protein product [Rotaria sp. Silwood1]
MNDTIKSDDKSRISIKFITYLLSVRKNSDSHLRGTYANILDKLIQTTFHLLTLSSLLNSFNNSFINQCLFVSIDSKDSPRLCLNDNNARVIHVSLNALRTLLTFSIN